MEYNFDLDVNNYKIDDLISFFNLSKNYSFVDLNNSEKIKIVNINSLTEINKEYKYNILTFISSAKKILSYKFVDTNDNPGGISGISGLNSLNSVNDVNNYELNMNDDIEEKDDIPINNIGKIINPLSNKPSLQTTSLLNNDIYGYNKQINTVSYVFNTQLRNNYFSSTSSDCDFTLPLKLKNVVSLTLTALQFPNVMLTFSSSRGTNQIYIKEYTTNNEAYVTIPDGNYSITDFPTILQNAINTQVNGGGARFTVSISQYTHFTTITNSTYNFSMNIVKKFSSFTCNNFEHPGISNPDSEFADKNNPTILPSMLFNSMGYYIGYRNIVYDASNSYTSESMFDPVFTDYVYFVLNDYNKNYKDVIMCVLPTSLNSENILALIPITSQQFSTTFEDASDLIFKSRQYDAPVNISKISVKILNQYGEVLNLYQNDYAFCIQVQTLESISGGNNFKLDRYVMPYP